MSIPRLQPCVHRLPPYVLQTATLCTHAATLCRCRFAGGNKSGVLTAEERRKVVERTSEAPSRRKEKCDRLLNDTKQECDEWESGYLPSFGIEFGGPSCPLADA